MSDIDNTSDLQFDNGDQSFRDQDENEQAEQEVAPQEVGAPILHDQAMPKEETVYDPDMSFERDVDTLLKVKARVMFNINKERQCHEVPIFYEDLTLNSIAMQYASSLKSGAGDQSYLQRLNEQEKFLLEYQTFDITSRYEEDVHITKKLTESFFIENAYLFLEMDKVREVILDPQYTHVGIGLAGNEVNVVIVLLVTRKDIALLEITETSQDEVTIRGKILGNSQYFYMAEIFNSDSKEIGSAMYDKVQYNRSTKEFTLHIEVETNWKERRWIQIYTSNSEHAGGRKPPPKERKNKMRKELNDKFLSLFILYPDERYLECYKEELQREKVVQGQLTGMLLESLQIEAELKEEQKEYSSHADEDRIDDSSEQQEEQHKQLMSKEQKTSNREIKQQLMLAINQAKNAHETVLYQNQRLQTKIKQLRDRNNISLDRTGEGSMNEHKYLNILAQVHQTRVQLQQTQDRYNRMSIELQAKLDQKQAKCEDIRKAFKDLKREVAKKATYSRSDQPIKGYKIEQWEDKQTKITEELQLLRLQILRARNSLSKNQKILKKKEELAEGLHLIDFQQLKIENQTLNQKIEQRNEDLHKLKKKTTNMVQTLTHTRQKLVFVEKMKSDLLQTTKKLDVQIQYLRNQIGQIKKDCEKLRLEIQDAKQETEIINSQELVIDFKKRAENIVKLEEQLKELLEREKEMKTVIEMYQRKMKKQAITR